MKNILDRITENFQERIELLQHGLERHKDWEVLHRTLNLRAQSCYELFGVTNTTLDNVEYLFRLFTNCFLDDATMIIKTSKSNYGKVTRFVYGSDDYIGIKESEMLEVLSLIEKYEECYDENDKFINDQTKHYYSIGDAVKAKINELEKKQNEAKYCNENREEFVEL